ncbi:MAG TPA: DUF438 domain-containing protein [Clostridia bacterium]|nr:DUF438 domain-containing protein [Clostridia bacterium]
MSEVINNRQHKQKILKELIMELHQGKSVEEVKERFASLIEGVSPAEISAMEQSLIAGGLPVEEVQRLCDVHASVFKGSLDEYHRAAAPEFTSGHPVHTFKMENRQIEKLIEEKIFPVIQSGKKLPNEETRELLSQGFQQLWEIDKHYSRKENLLFPYLEKHGITAPPKVMWGVDDEIRALIKQVMNPAKEVPLETLMATAEEAVHRVKEMIYKEENIMFPMALDTLTGDEWDRIIQESDDIGYCLYQPEIAEQKVSSQIVTEPEVVSSDVIRLETGVLDLEQLTGILNHLPLDITFIDKDNIVRYFSQGKERIFARTKAIIGRKVENCHPPGSVHIVEKLVADFKSGAKDNEDFWIWLGDTYAYIRYFAVRDEDGEYLGTLEVTQNITSIQKIEGEKRLITE